MGRPPAGDRARSGLRNLDIRARALELRLNGETHARIASQLGLSRQRIQALLRPPQDVEAALIERADGQCEECGIDVRAKGAAHIHHRDMRCIEGEYGDVGNLALLCLGCHSRHHGRPPQGEQAFPRQGWSVKGADKALTQELRIAAIRQGRTVGDCINEAIKDWLRKERTMDMKSWRVSDKLSEIRAAILAEGGAECGAAPEHGETARRSRCGICGEPCDAYGFRDVGGRYHAFGACSIHDDMAFSIY